MVSIVQYTGEETTLKVQLAKVVMSTIPEDASNEQIVELLDLNSVKEPTELRGLANDIRIADYLRRFSIVRLIDLARRRTDLQLVVAPWIETRAKCVVSHTSGVQESLGWYLRGVKKESKLTVDALAKVWYTKPEVLAKALGKPSGSGWKTNRLGMVAFLDLLLKAHPVDITFERRPFKEGNC